MTRTKSAVIVFVVLAAAVVAAVSLDYTDTYVADRFHKALGGGRYTPGEPFSLDAFLEYYDWDRVCVCSADSPCPDLTTRLGRPYSLDVQDPSSWSLVLVKSYYVMAEIPILRERLESPEVASGECFERWKAIVEISEKGGVRRLLFVAE